MFTTSGITLLNILTYRQSESELITRDTTTPEAFTVSSIVRVVVALSDGKYAQAPCIRRVGVCSNHHTSGEGIIFQYNLVDDACTGFPKPDAVFT